MFYWSLVDREDRLRVTIKQEWTLMSLNPKPFKINVSQAVLNDLTQRLARTRFPDKVEGANWTYGTNLGYMKSLIDY